MNMEIVSKLILIIGVLALGTSVITQVIKNIPILKKIPTDVVVFIISIILTISSTIAYMQINNINIMWYYIVSSIVGSFFVSFVAMFGWDKLTELIKRFIKKDE